MARNVCTEDLSGYSGHTVVIPKGDNLLPSLFAANIKGLGDLNTKCDFKQRIGYDKVKYSPGYKGTGFIGAGDGIRIANYLNAKFSDPLAVSPIKDMITELKKNGNRVGTVNPAELGFNVRFHENTNDDAGVSGNAYNFFFNLDITNTTTGQNKEIVTITFHTNLSAPSTIGAFHVKDKSNDVAGNPKISNYIRIKICEDAATSYLSLKRAYTKQPAGINQRLVDPFVENFIEIFEIYLNNGCAIPAYVPIVAPPSTPSSTPTLTPSANTTANGNTNTEAANNAAAMAGNTGVGGVNTSAAASKLGLNPTAKEFIPGSASTGGKRKKRKTGKNRKTKRKTRKTNRR